ncbi:MAG: hypothetical protein MUF00_04545 [Gemmatimonadaceae bacterium]|jgi:hypothetical protein|nr:hypothetical protein [Gemmatimonadaceae bacterium]
MMRHHLLQIVSRARIACGALALALGTVACEHPIAVVTPHAEVADLILRDSSGVQLAATRDNRVWDGGPLVVPDGGVLVIVPTLLDFEGRTLDVLETRRDLELRAEVERDGITTWEPLRGRGRWFGLAPGRTRVRFLVWHQTHADLVTPWLPLDVRAAPVSR